MLAAQDSPKPPRTPNSGKRFRPPVLDITQALERKPTVQLEIGPTPVKLHPGDADETAYFPRPNGPTSNHSEDMKHGSHYGAHSESHNCSISRVNEPKDDIHVEQGEEETLQLSPYTPTFVADIVETTTTEADDTQRELQMLRDRMQNNLRLRPIRSKSNLRIELGPEGSTLPPALSSTQSSFTLPPMSAASWTSAPDSNPPESAISTYFTPLTGTPHHGSFAPGPSTTNGLVPPLPTTGIMTDEPMSISATPFNPPPARAVPPKELSDRLRSRRRPLLIDTRSLAAHEAFHIRTSINIAIPSLILKRSKKPGGGFGSLAALKQHITTEGGKAIWDHLVGTDNDARNVDSAWDGDVVIYDDDMNPADRMGSSGSMAWGILALVAPLLSYGNVGYLEGGISSAGHDPDLQTLILSGEEAAAAAAGGSSGVAQQPSSTMVQAPPQKSTLRKKASAGLFQLDTKTTYRSRQLPELEPSSTTDVGPLQSCTIPSSHGPAPPPSPLPLMPTSTSSSSSESTPPLSSAKTTPSPRSTKGLLDSSPSPPPSSLAGFRRPPPPRRPSVPNLRRSMERINTDLPKLSLRTKPMRSATLAAPPSLTLQVPSSPTHLKLVTSSHSPISPGGPVRRMTGPASAYPSDNHRTQFFTPPHSPATPKGTFSFSLDAPSPATHGASTSFSTHRSNHPSHLPDPPPTARPDASFSFDDRPLSTGEEEDAFPQFTVSTILPDFLFLGPELTSKEHVDKLRGLGVKRILNIAAECDDDQGLGLRQVFDRYLRIPMRDTVEEDGITRGVREVCDFLDDARLHSAPTYVHCKAGKSRSVTAVMAYLIHANRWTLSRAYSFVMERRKGISPNIGFVSELMNFEEAELGNKSTGVQPSAPVVMGPGGSGSGVDMQDGFAAAIASGSSSSSAGVSGRVGGGGLRNPHTAQMVRSRTYVRDSLPPIGMSEGDEGGPPIDLVDRVMGDPGGEMEIKDASGRYRHARRPPVNESTLQPMRRVSKAGLESSVGS